MATIDYRHPCLLINMENLPFSISVTMAICLSLGVHYTTLRGTTEWIGDAGTRTRILSTV